MSYTSIYVAGMDPTGATDSTAAITAAMNALPSNGGTLIIPPTNGYYKMNLVINRNNVTIVGPGSGFVNTGNYLRAYDTTKPVIQIGNTAGDLRVEGCTLKDITLDGGNSCQYGLSFKGGAMYNQCFNITIWNFTNRCLEFTNADVQPCEYNKIIGLVIESSANGANGIVFEDKHVAGGGWTTAAYIEDFNVSVSAGLGTGTTAGGHPVIIDSAGCILSNGYIQLSQSGHGVLMRKGWTYNPSVSFSCVNIDISTATSFTFTVDTSFDLYGASAAGQIRAINGVAAGFSLSGKVFYVAGHTTGTISAASTSLSVATATGIYAGRQISVLGAGAGGNYLTATVVSVSGTTVTLDTAATTSVATADVCFGNATNDVTFKSSSSPSLVGVGLFLSGSSKTGVDGDGMRGQLFRASGGAAAPYNNNEFVWDLGSTSTGINFVNDNGAGTAVSTITQSGTTVTVTTAGSHNLAVGDLVRILGVNEPGINGTWAVLARTSATVFTFTSSVSQTLAGVTGSPTFSGNRYVRIVDGHVELSTAGIKMRNQSGTMNNLITHNQGNGQLTHNTPDTTNGTFSFIAGSSLTASDTAWRVSAGGSNAASLTGTGTLYLRSAAAPTTIATGGIYYADSNGRAAFKDAAGNVGSILTTATSSATATTAAPTLTASTTAVMMGCTGTITPIASTRMLVTISGQVANSVAGSGATVDFRYGTGTKPSNGAAASGNVVGIPQSVTSVSAAQKSGFSVTGIISGLTVGTAYWLDASLMAVTSGNAAITGVTITAIEI